MTRKVSDVTVTINGVELTGREGMTILELAQENGIDIPTLCYSPDLPPIGACRLCVVEVEGSRTLVGSCHTPIAPGMVVYTHSPKVLATRKAIMELMLASHCGFCIICDKANLCDLRKIAADLEVGLPRFQVRKRYYPIEDVSPHLQRDLSKCVLCRRCIVACQEIAKQNVFSTGYRGFDSKVVVDCDEPINKDVCRDCDICVSFCPTGALTKPRKLGEEKKGTPLVITG